MVDSRRPQDIEVEELLRNAELRNALEPFYDEAISRVNVQHLPLAMENDFLAAMLAWEQAPVLPIYRWFDPELRPPRPSVLTDENLHEILWDVVRKMFKKRIVLDFTEHLSDRELYTLIYRDILPSREKMIDSRVNYLHWDCTGPSRDPEIWLRYYATEEDREMWAETYHLPLPEQADPPYPRNLPHE
ncbi:MAG TPA: hypothetical protein VJL29_06760 [Thermoguttaceae bacterium]|nr:hypothetical protein [Thermoguttaceae bacterium]